MYKQVSVRRQTGYPRIWLQVGFGLFLAFGNACFTQSARLGSLGVFQ